MDRNGRDMQSVRQALERLKQGRLLGLFPEGRLNGETPNDRLLAGDTGVAWLALKAAVPVIPIFIQNAPRSGSMVWVFFRRAGASDFWSAAGLNSVAGASQQSGAAGGGHGSHHGQPGPPGGIGYTPCARPPAQSA